MILSAFLSRICGNESSHHSERRKLTHENKKLYKISSFVATRQKKVVSGNDDDGLKEQQMTVNKLTFNLIRKFKFLT